MYLFKTAATLIVMQIVKDKNDNNGNKYIN